MCDTALSKGDSGAGVGRCVRRQTILSNTAAISAAPTPRCQAIKPSGRVPLWISGMTQPITNWAAISRTTSQ
ncbi:hypothetical protein A6V36_25260 [Paraburkholderia ginsengiterrae]|uniref:Uncharacterized protein n=1 Tax=Paraburkholderia ginsengiterrae TaxID=1462993 RepID=A0ABX2UXN9_9BURK|nr:hypothetical protein A6V36_25260 [Paraburkholderia ginsengiterrae]